MTRPNLSSTAFWDVDMQKLDYEANARFVIEKVMNYGLWADMLEILRYYGRERVKSEITQAAYLKKKTLSFCCAIFDPHSPTVPMLYPATVEPATLELLKRLMQVQSLEPFALAGGTNLALQFGHRLSVDLDLFTDQPFPTQELFDELILNFPLVIKTDEAKNALSLFIDGVKVDLLAHRYPLIKPFTNESGIRLWSVEDVVAMKLGAVSGRGAKKDFWDIAELLNHFTLTQMLEFFTAKYANSDPGYVIRSLTYFDDAELQADPIGLKSTTWPVVKQQIIQAVRKLT